MLSIPLRNPGAASCTDVGPAGYDAFKAAKEKEQKFTVPLLDKSRHVTSLTTKKGKVLECKSESNQTAIGPHYLTLDGQIIVDRLMSPWFVVWGSWLFFIELGFGLSEYRYSFFKFEDLDNQIFDITTIKRICFKNLVQPVGIEAEIKSQKIWEFHQDGTIYRDLQILQQPKEGDEKWTMTRSIVRKNYFAFILHHWHFCDESMKHHLVLCSPKRKKKIVDIAFDTEIRFVDLLKLPGYSHLLICEDMITRPQFYRYDTYVGSLYFWLIAGKKSSRPQKLELSNRGYQLEVGANDAKIKDSELDILLSCVDDSPMQYFPDTDDEFL